MKRTITSIIVAVILLTVLFNTSDFLTKVIVLPFIFFAVGLGLKNILVIMKKETMAANVKKVYTVAFLIYWFGFLICWDYISCVNGKYMQILFSIPLWLGGIYFAYKRLFKKDKK